MSILQFEQFNILVENEARINFVREKYKDSLSEEQINILIEEDPTRNKLS